MKTFHISFINNKNAAYMVVAENKNSAKKKVCQILDIHYPNSYLTSSVSGIGKTCLGLIK